MCGDPSQAIETQACHEDRVCAKSDGVGPGCFSGKLVHPLNFHTVRHSYVIFALILRNNKLFGKLLKRHLFFQYKSDEMFQN